jgi:GxxExxY protein
MTLMKAINEKVYKIIGSCMEVHRTLGPGYSVDFYKKGLEVEFPLKELPFESKKTLQVVYKDVLVGTLEIDFIIDGDVVLMIRSQDGLKDSEIQQVLRCITMTEAAMGILVNFGLSKIQYKRVVPSQQQKEFRKDIYQVSAYRQLGKTREGNPAV